MKQFINRHSLFLIAASLILLGAFTVPPLMQFPTVETKTISVSESITVSDDDNELIIEPGIIYNTQVSASPTIYSEAIFTHDISSTTDSTVTPDGYIYVTIDDTVRKIPYIND